MRLEMRKFHEKLIWHVYTEAKRIPVVRPQFSSGEKARRPGWVGRQLFADNFLAKHYIYYLYGLLVSEKLALQLSCNISTSLS